MSKVIDGYEILRIKNRVARNWADRPDHTDDSQHYEFQQECDGAIANAQRDSSDKEWIEWLQKIGWEDNGLFSFPVIYWYLLKRKR